MPVLRVTQLVFDGVADGPAALTLDVVAAARTLDRTESRSTSTVRVVSIDGRAVRTAAGRRMEVDGSLATRGLARGDVLVLPGLGMATPPSLRSALERGDIRRGIAAVGRAAARGILVAASCSATFVVASSGALDGHEATTTWWLAPLFRERFPRVALRTDRMVVAAGAVLTAGSAFAHADLMLAIVARTRGPSLAHNVARHLILDERTSQARYMIAEHLRSDDPTVRALERFVTRNVSRQLGLAEMARATATSPRTLARRVHEALGTTPLRFAQQIRVARAAHLLETSRNSVETVAEQVGYADPAAFRRVFRRFTGEPPGARRRR